MDGSVRVLVFTGSGRSFFAGDDLGQVEAPPRQVTALHSGYNDVLGTSNALRVISQALN